MKIDKHVMYRFVQRIMGIKGDKEIQQYISKNRYEVVYKLLEFVNEAELLIENFAPGRKDALDYYINGETLIVMKPKKSEVVTLYDVTLDTEDRENTLKIKQYVKSIRKNNSRIRHLRIQQKKQNPITDHLEYMLKYLDGELNESQIKTG